VSKSSINIYSTDFWFCQGNATLKDGQSRWACGAVIAGTICDALEHSA
jgi:hypothetical protein